MMSLRSSRTVTKKRGLMQLWLSRNSLCRSGWPLIYRVPPASAFQRLRLKACTTIHIQFFFLKSFYCGYRAYKFQIFNHMYLCGHIQVTGVLLFNVKTVSESLCASTHIYVGSAGSFLSSWVSPNTRTGRCHVSEVQHAQAFSQALGAIPWSPPWSGAADGEQVCAQLSNTWLPSSRSFGFKGHAKERTSKPHWPTENELQPERCLNQSIQMK